MHGPVKVKIDKALSNVVPTRHLPVYAINTLNMRLFWENPSSNRKPNSEIWEACEGFSDELILQTFLLKEILDTMLLLQQLCL